MLDSSMFGGSERAPAFNEGETARLSGQMSMARALGDKRGIGKRFHANEKAAELPGRAIPIGISRSPDW